MTIQATPVYTLGSWTGNVTDPYNVDWVVTGEDGWSSSPPIRPIQEDKTAGDGTWAGPGTYGARVISLTGRAMADDRLSMLAAKDRLKAAIGPRSLATLRVDEAHMSRCARVRLTDQIQIVDWGAQAFEWTLILTASDPRRYAVTTTTDSTGLPSVATSGRTYDRIHDFSYGPLSGDSGSVFFTNEGDFDQTPARFTIYGPVSSPQIAHIQSGRSLTFDLVITDDQYLEVDLLSRTVMLNGTASRATTITPDSAWFYAFPGLNEFQFRGAAGVGATTPVMSMTAASAWT